MTIRKRKKANTTYPEHKGRHKLLKLGSVYYSIFYFIKANPGVTRRQIVDGTGISTPTCTGRVAEMKAAGLLIDGPKVLCPTTRKHVASLYVVECNVTGVERDIIEVELKIKTDIKGAYFVQAKVLNFETSIDGSFLNSNPLVTKIVKVAVPKSSEPMALQSFANKSCLTINGDYSIVN